MHKAPILNLGNTYSNVIKLFVDSGSGIENDFCTKILVFGPITPEKYIGPKFRNYYLEELDQ